MKTKTLAKITTYLLLAIFAVTVIGIFVLVPTSAIVTISMGVGFLAVGMVKPSARMNSVVIMHAALADHSSRAAVVAAGTKISDGGVIDYIEFQVNCGVVDTDVPTGGLVELENDALDWRPFEFYTQKGELLTTTGFVQKVMRIPVRKTLPSDSKIYVYYTAHNAATDCLMVTVHWIIGGSAGKQTFSISGKDTAFAATAFAWNDAVITLSIPSLKGGRAVLFQCLTLDSPETAVTSGYVVRLRCNKATWEPTEGVTEGITGKTTAAGCQMPHSIVLDHPLPANSDVFVDVKAVDNQSQGLLCNLLWEISSKMTVLKVSTQFF